MQLMLCQLISAVDLSRKSLNDRLSHVTIERSAEVCQSSDSNFLRKLSHEFSFKKTVILCHHNYFFFFIPSKNFLSLSLVALFICYYFVHVSIYLSTIFSPNWILLFEKIQNTNATCLNTIRDIEKLSTVLVSL
jgi:hypothetical protein